MAVEIKVTPAGESITHATLLKWLKPDGAAVKAGEPVCELETDKATKEEYAPGAVVGSVDPAGTPKASTSAPAAAAPKTGNSVAQAPPPADDVRLSPAARVL